VKRVQRHLVPNDLVSKRHDLVYTALWHLVPKERVPMDLGHAVASTARRTGYSKHVHKARKGLVSRVDAPSVRASAVADATVIQISVSDNRDPIDHLGRANVRVHQAFRPKLAWHVRVGGSITG